MLNTDDYDWIARARVGILRRKRFLVDENDVDDALQVAYMAVWRACQLWCEDDGVAANTYVTRSVQNRLWDYVGGRGVIWVPPSARRKVRRKVKADRSLAWDVDRACRCELTDWYDLIHPPADRDDSRLVAQEEVEDILARLRPEERELLTLYYGLNGQDSLTFNEIGRRLGVSLQAIHNRFTSLKHRLQKQFGQCAT